jgi:predicted CXXCH cytochrome family protein
LGDIGRIGRRLTVLALLGLLAVLAFWAFFGSTSADYVGSEKCGDCHSGNYDDWRATLHGIDFANPEEYSYNKYTRGSSDAENGTFGSCAPCHTTGWDDMANGGTDPDEAWNSTHNLPLGSIGCENCHGPGGDHIDDRAGNPEFMQLGEFTYSLACAGWATTSNTDRPGAEFEGETIQMCHDGYRMGGTIGDYVGYYDSAHAGGIDSSSPKGNPSCYHCMAADGFISVTIEGNDAPDEITYDETADKYYVDGKEVVYGIYCLACHDPHPDADAEGHDYQLRADEDEICTLCHYNTHEYPTDHISHPTSEFRAGINGKDVPEIEFMEEVSCPECHMWASSGHGTPPVHVGHSFEVAPQACVACHSMYTNESAQAWIDGVHEDWDAWMAMFGDGETGLMADAEARMAWAEENGLWDDATDTLYWEAYWDYGYPEADGSMGAHNPVFMDKMFDAAYEKFQMVMDNTNMGGVEGTVTWTKSGDAIEGAKIMDGHGTTVATTDADGKYFFWAMADGANTYVIEDSEGTVIGSMSADATVMTNVTKDVSLEKPSGGGDDGEDGEDEGLDTMHYAFIGIIVLLIIILIVVAMMGKKSE